LSGAGYTTSTCRSQVLRRTIQRGSPACRTSESRHATYQPGFRSKIKPPYV
jgi:hypothetical protein